MTSDMRTSPTISSCSGMTVAPQPAFSFGYSRSSRAEIACISASACARSTPGFSRAMAWWLWLSRIARSLSVNATGTRMSRAATDHDLTEKLAGITPTIVYASPSSVSVRPIASGAPPKRLFQNP